jgi:nucleoside phosphorylase
MKNSITIDGIEYVRADSTHSNTDTDGLRYAIVRSRDQGVMSGFVRSIDGRAVTLAKARQLWRWKSSFTLVEMASSGGASDGCRFSAEAAEDVVMLEACGVLYCSGAGVAFLRGVAAESH